MQLVRRFLQSAFGFLALIYISAAFMALGHLPDLLASIKSALAADGYQGASGLRWLALVAVQLLNLLFLSASIPLAALYATTWLTLHSCKPPARVWALTASSVTLLQGIPFMVLTVRYWGQTHGALNEGFLVLIAVPLIVGIPGILAFAPRNSLASLARPAQPRVQGDGTSRNMDRFALVLQVAIVVVAGEVWWRWQRTRDLSRLDGVAGWLPLLAELAVVVVLHELGHILAGLAGGMKLSGLILGPFHFFQSDGDWKFRFMFGAAGAVRMVPIDAKRNLGSRVFYFAGGPIVTLLTGLGFLLTAAAIPGNRSELLWEFCSWTGILSLGLFTINLIPMRTRAFYSDGAKIYQALTHSPVDDYTWILSFSGSIYSTPNRPRDFDLGAIRRVASSEAAASHAVLLRLMESDCLLDRGLVAESARALEMAQAAYLRQPEALTANAICSFVYGHAVLRSDAVMAHAWAERLEEGQGVSPDDRWLCSAALACADGRKDEAMGVLARLDHFHRDRQASGLREFNLFLVQSMRERVNADGPTSAAAVHGASSAGSSGLINQLAY